MPEDAKAGRTDLRELPLVTIDGADVPGRSVDHKLLQLATSALLHDVGDAKFHAGVERSGELARQIQRNLLPRRTPHLPGLEIAVGSLFPATP